ncbi:MAG: hypothetical protein HY318_11480 [Armatimonadetes bacterium]|nr:hypothetical protein [Armatimonadota bacterium]
MQTWWLNKGLLKHKTRTSLAAGLLVALLTAGQAVGEKATGPLRVHPTNPRYFTDGSGKAVYLTGSHTWTNFQDGGWQGSSPERLFDYKAYLDFLQAHNHNFIRLWTPETAANHLEDGTWALVDPVPYRRTGPGEALDGKPRFDLTKLNQAYFDRLCQRVLAAGERGIYVAVMLFDLWGVGGYNNLGAWQGHPFHKDNNVNGINGDPDGDGKGLESHTLQIPAITALQKAYVEKVMDTVGDLDNVLYEIINEGYDETKEWQYHLVDLIKQYEAAKPKQHPVGINTLNLPLLFGSRADWISPGSVGYRDDPPAADGRKVVISDTDRLWGVGGDHRWVWKSFLRGHNPIYMDRIAAVTGSPEGDLSVFEGARKAMGHTRTLANRMNLAEMTPRNDLASTQYCLANPGKEYLVYLPEGGEVTVDLSVASGVLEVEWFNPSTGTATNGGTIEGGAKLSFKVPFEGDAVLYVRRKP